MHILFYISIAISICYLLLMLYLTFGWLSLGEYHRDNRPPHTKVSIIIAVRNEIKTIENCLHSISLQDYNKALFEVIVIDDHSEDKTVNYIKSFIDNHPELLIRLVEQSQAEGKKKAIAQGIHRSNGTLIITTDADCTMGPQWLSTTVNYYETYGVSMIAGPVEISDEKNIFEKMQSLEFLSLIATTASTITLNLPLMCNGANLAFEKEAYQAIGSNQLNAKYTSGDDVFLLKQIKYKLKERIGFIKHPAAIVSTQAQPTVSSFINQRIRWVSKTKGSSDSFLYITSFIIYLFNLLIPTLVIFGIFEPIILKIALILLMLKLLIDLPIMAGIAFFMNKTKSLIWYIPLQFINLFYISLIGLIGNFKGFYWKNRYYKQ